MGNKGKWFDPKAKRESVPDDLIVFPTPKQLIRLTPELVEEFLQELKRKNVPLFVHKVFESASQIRPAHRRVLESVRKAVTQLSSVSSFTQNDLLRPQTLLDVEYRALIEIQHAGIDARLIAVAHVLLCLAERESAARFILELTFRHNQKPDPLSGDAH